MICSRQLDAAKNEPKFQPIVIKPAATQADIAFVESHRADLPVLELMMVQRRRYQHGDMLANAIGYVGEVSAQHLEDSDGHYRPGDIVGKAGLERSTTNSSKARTACAASWSTASAKWCAPWTTWKPSRANRFSSPLITILQAIAETDMANKEGAVVAMDARTGEILAMVSQPTFDPNDFAVRIPQDEWQKLNTDPATPLLNRAIQAQLAPGSVFKIVMATAMLDSKTIPETYTRYCPGYADFYGREFHCWRPQGHGEWICTEPSSIPATSSSTTSAKCSASTRSLTTDPAWAWACAQALICPAKSRA